MKNSKHTPAPWSATTQHDGHYIHGNTPLGVNAIARVYPRSYTSTDEPQMNEEADANAKLIVSSPDLFKELSDVYDVLDAFVSNQKMSSEEALKQIIELRNNGLAIKKAIE